MTFKRIVVALMVLALLLASYFAVVLNWSYSTGERAGWIQKLSHKGWLCKTWEGEVALVSLPGSATVEKFQFTVRDDAIAAELAKVDGQTRHLALRRKGRLADQLLRRDAPLRHRASPRPATSRSRPAWWCRRRRRLHPPCRLRQRRVSVRA